MNEKRIQPVADSSAWRGADLANDNSWITTLSPGQRREIRSAVDSVKARGLPFSEIRLTDFSLPLLGPILENLQDLAENHRGVVLVRGLPVEEYGVEDNERMAAGICAHLGTLVVQSRQGTLIGHVKDLGLSRQDISVPGYKTSEESAPHCDTGDLLGLVCLQQAKSGGVSTISSSTSIYNEILSKHPEYLDTLYTGFHYNIRGNGPPGEFVNVTRHRVPVYDYHEGRLSCRFHQQAIKTAEQWPGVDPISEFDKQAIDYIASLAMDPAFRYDFYLNKGDLLLMNNNTVLHTRSSFVDDDDPKLKRLLLRLWINLPNGRKLREEFADHYNTGPRQGPFVQA